MDRGETLTTDTIRFFRVPSALPRPGMDREDRFQRRSLSTNCDVEESPDE